MSNKIFHSVLLGTIILLAIFVGWKFLAQNNFELPQGETKAETIIVQDGQVIDDPKIIEDAISLNDNDSVINTGDKPKIFKTKEIMITDGVKHSIPLDDILSGGPPKDGIPSVDNPKFISIEETGDFLSDDDLGLAIDMDGVQKFYPFKILVWHEIVNDKINGQRILVTYCPLCLSGIVFDPLVNGQRVEFGVSGKLWNSNLLMYDRKNDNLWSQVLGEAVLGDLTGTQLQLLPSDQMKYGQWVKENPNGLVMSKDTGISRSYGNDPYGDYYFTPGIFFPVDNKDDRLKEKDFILGLVINGQAKAYYSEAIKKVGELADNFAGQNLLIKYEADIDAVRIYAKASDGSLTRLNPFTSFWFAWVAIHPETELYK